MYAPASARPDTIPMLKAPGTTYVAMAVTRIPVPIATPSSRSVRASRMFRTAGRPVPSSKAIPETRQAEEGEKPRRNRRTGTKHRHVALRLVYSIIRSRVASSPGLSRPAWLARTDTMLANPAKATATSAIVNRVSRSSGFILAVQSSYGLQPSTAIAAAFAMIDPRCRVILAARLLVFVWADVYVVIGCDPSDLFRVGLGELAKPAKRFLEPRR
jgi:hypothetical protein